MTELALIRRATCDETIELLESLLHKARAGEVTGIAVTAWGPGGKHVTGWAGLAKRDPVTTIHKITQAKAAIAEHYGLMP